MVKLKKNRLMFVFPMVSMVKSTLFPTVDPDESPIRPMESPRMGTDSGKGSGEGSAAAWRRRGPRRSDECQVFLVGALDTNGIVYNYSLYIYIYNYIYIIIYIYILVGGLEYVLFFPVCWE